MRPEAPAKPPIGDPCNGCGLCCRFEICGAGSFTLGLVERYGQRAPGPCPALWEQPDGTATCGMVERPRDFALGKGGAHDLRAAISVLIGAGAGCDEASDDEDPSALADVQQRYLDRVGIDGIQRAVSKWYGLGGSK